MGTETAKPVNEFFCGGEAGREGSSPAKKNFGDTGIMLEILAG